MEKENKSYQLGDHVVKTEGARQFGVVVPGCGGEASNVRWSDGRVTSLTYYPVAPAKEHM